MIRVLTDSAADLPTPICEEYHIQVIPIHVYLDGTEYKDGVDIDPPTFYRRVSAGVREAKTAQINPPTYAKAFERALSDGSDVVYVGLSSGLSGSVQSALMARDMVSAPHRITVVDSLGASLGQGLMAVRAAELAGRGWSAAEVAAGVEEYRNRLYHVFTLNTLDFARKSGRVTAVAALAAGLLDIKPILRMDMEGHIVALDKTRGRKKALHRLVDELQQKARDLEGQTIGISGAEAEAEVSELAGLLLRQFGVGRVITGQIGPTVGAHVGPGTIALFFGGEPGRA